MHVQDGLTYVGELTIDLPTKTPLEKAQAEIRNLCMRTDLMGNVMLGPGKLSPEDVAENERKSDERSRLRREIILKYGVEEHFLAPLRTEAERLVARLREVRDQIADLEAGIAKRDQ